MTSNLVTTFPKAEHMETEIQVSNGTLPFLLVRNMP